MVETLDRHARTRKLPRQSMHVTLRPDQADRLHRLHLQEDVPKTILVRKAVEQMLKDAGL